MTDEEIIASWMEPITKPPDSRDTQWWKSTIVIDTNGEPVYKWIPRNLDLNALHLVQSRLRGDQWIEYAELLMDPAGVNHTRFLLHATVTQKIKALASVLRPEVEK